MVLYFTIYDMPLIYNGQEVGMNKSMGLFEVARVEWSPANPVIGNLFRLLTALKRTQKALESGSRRGSLVTYTTTDEANVYAYSRKRDDNEVLVLLNFSNAPVNVRFIGATPQGDFYILTGLFETTGQMQFTNQTNVSLPANGYAIYVKY
jgi:glycosidase